MRADSRRFDPADAAFVAFLVSYAAVSLSLLPYDFTDLCYLFSLERGMWVTQEWVHPIYVPTLRVLAGLLNAVGYHGRMLVPVEVMNVAVASAAYALLYGLARRVSGPSLTAVVVLAVAATSTGFWNATVRSTPYALALFCQVVALSCLVSERPVSAARYALAGAFAGLSMGYHASAMALSVAGLVSAVFEPDPGRTRRDTIARIAAFGSAMLAVAIASWAIFIAYNRLGRSYFRTLDLDATFHGIEQVPNTSIYTSGSVAAQLSTFAATIGYQAGVLVRVAVVVLLFMLGRWLWARRPLGAAERRLVIVAAGNFAAIAGFFLINNTHNGFIFASLAFVPVLIAAALGRSWVGLALVVCLTLSGTASNVERMLRSGVRGSNDPQLTEVRYLEQRLGGRDVLLTPGSPFPEILYLSHLNVFEVSLGEPTQRGSEVPVVRPGDALRARIASWIANGGRVIYALGDESTDFTGDLGGAEKERQVFWRNETVARERVPVLRELRVALEASGIAMDETLASPRGNRYAEIRIDEPAGRAAAGPRSQLVGKTVSAAELPDLFRSGDEDGGGDPQLARRAQYLAELQAALPDDPWLGCDVAELICEGRPRRRGEVVPCEPPPGCEIRAGRGDGEPSARSAHEPAAAGCFWGPVGDKKLIDEYLADWARQQRLGPIADWSFEANHDSAVMRIVLPEGKLALTWRLSESCAPGPVDLRGTEAASRTAVSSDGLQQLVAGLPIAKVHAGKDPRAK